MSEWSIRTGTADDIPALPALWRAADSAPTVTDDEASIVALLANDPGSLLVAEQEGEVIGSLIAAWDGWRGSFYRLAVDPRWRRRGLATALVAAGEQRLIALGAVRLTAIVATDEEAALDLWASAGYRRQSARARFVRTLDPDREP